MRPVELSPSEVQHQIRSRELLDPGDYAKFITSNGDISAFRIEKIDLENDAIIGDEDSVQIAAIVTVETTEFRPFRTMGVATSMYLVGVFLVVLAYGAEF